MFRLYHNLVFSRQRRRSVSLADGARDNGNPAQAAVFYQATMDRWGETPGLLMQLGNALKDSMSFDQAEAVYLRVWNGPNRNADVALQLGHLMKTQNNLAAALGWYERSISLDQASDNPAHVERASLDELSRSSLGAVNMHGVGFTVEQINRPAISINFRDELILRQLHNKRDFRRI